MKTIDLHCDTIMQFWMGKKLSEMQDAHINLAKLKAGNVGLQCFAIFVPTGDTAKGWTVILRRRRILTAPMNAFWKK